MTETTTPTPAPNDLRVYADNLESIAREHADALTAFDRAELRGSAALLRSAASALDAKGETTGEKPECNCDIDTHCALHGVRGIRRDGAKQARAHVDSLAVEPAAPPLAPSSEPQSGGSDMQFVDIVFDGPPSHESGRFVEVENERGKSISLGEWVHRADGYWALRISALPASRCPPCKTRRRR